MAGKNRESAGLGFKLVAVLVTLIVIAVVFSVAFGERGLSSFRAGLNAAIPVGSGIIAAMVLGSISKIRHRRWGIYLYVLIAVAIFLVLRLFRIL